VVLDFGSARTETVGLLSRFRCRLEIAELADSIDTLNAADLGSDELRTRAEALLPKRRQEPTDVVFCWDLLNYVSRQALAALMECVAARSRRGTLVHALIYYSAPLMPSRPSCFVPVDGQRLLNVNPQALDRKAPRYSPEDLQHCMPRYEVDRARLLRNGMQEFLFRL
jgi:hypothetical protein